MDPNKQQYPYPGYPQGQAYPAQPYPAQPYPNAGYPNAGYPNAGYPNAGYPNPGMQNPGYPVYQGAGVDGGQFGPPPVGFNMPFRQDIEHPKPDDDSHNISMPGADGMEFSDKSVRRGFIRKVYSILMVQLVVSVGFIALFTYHSGVKGFMRANPWFYIVAMLGFFVMVITLSCCSSVRRKSPTNFICLGIFTVFASVMLGAVSSTYKEESVLLAVGICAVVCFALTLFSFQTKFDFTRLNGFLFVAAIILIVFGFVAMFLGHKFPILRIVYAAAGALLFSVYLIHDTQLIMGGDHKYSISPEEYIFAALNIYLDIFNIFLSILSLVGSRS